jgi:hypothetical protein
MVPKKNEIKAMASTLYISDHVDGQKYYGGQTFS